MHNKLSYKVLIGSFIVATLFWFSIDMSGTLIARFAIPLTVVNLPPDIAIANALPDNIEVSLQGSGWQLLYLSISNQLAFEFPGKRLRSDRMIVTGKYVAEALKLPAGVHAIQVYPETLYVDIDRFVEKKVPLTLPMTTLTFRKEYGLTGPITLTPDSVVISGADRVVRNITTWSAEPRSFLDLAQTVNEDIPLKDSLAGVVALNVKTVRLTIPVQLLADVTYPGVPVTVSGVPPGKEVLLLNSTLTLVIRGGMGSHDTLKAEDFSAHLDYQSIIHDSSGTVIPTITSPPGLQILSIDPPRIKYVIRQK